MIFKFNNMHIMQGQLFSDAEMGMRESAERKKVVDAMSPMADELVKAFEQAMNDHIEEVRKHSLACKETAYRSNHLHGMILERLARLDDVTLDEIYSGNKNRYLKICGFLFWVKKIDKRNRPSINHTKHAGIMTAQMVEEGRCNDALLILGYELSEDGFRIKNLKILYQSNGKNLWAPISLLDLANADKNYVSSIQSTTNNENLVRIKGDIGKKRTADDSRV